MWLRYILVTSLMAFNLSSAASAEEMFETFENNPASRWTYFADTVMGGVSTGNATFDNSSSGAFVRLAGEVSTQNNGGFIQVRRDLAAKLPGDTQGVRLSVRGNGGVYFLHLRTTGTRLPWQYYQAQFKSTGEWTDVHLTLSAFKPSGRLLRKALRADTITSVGIVAFGSNHTAQIDVREVSWY
ncbi:MAG: CIA30 family protein [Shimia sp.]|uniref:CIA30 family protein n=1 Tax=Shimia sp. TaxID=1954381 RepID=UPI004058BE1A